MSDLLPHRNSCQWGSKQSRLNWTTLSFCTNWSMSSSFEVGADESCCCSLMKRRNECSENGRGNIYGYTACTAALKMFSKTRTWYPSKLDNWSHTCHRSTKFKITADRNELHFSLYLLQNIASSAYQSNNEEHGRKPSMIGKSFLSIWFGMTGAVTQISWHMWQSAGPGSTRMSTFPGMFDTEQSVLHEQG